MKSFIVAAVALGFLAAPAFQTISDDLGGAAFAQSKKRAAKEDACAKYLKMGAPTAPTGMWDQCRREQATAGPRRRTAGR